MKVNSSTLHCFGKEDVREVLWEVPELSDDEIEVSTRFCGVCRSDIGNYIGAELMPYSNEKNPNGIIGTWGHEGVGVVTKIGKNITDAKIGDYVATWSDPAYSYVYHAKQNQYVVIPELDGKYILQPVICAINIAEETLKYAKFKGYENERILLIGTGFMSLVIGQLYKDKIDVVGNSNRDHWNQLGINLYTSFNTLPQEKYKVIIDLSSKAENFDIITKKIADFEALICYAATPFTPVTTNFFENCWNCHTLIMPSPRNIDFKEKAKLTVELIKLNKLRTEFLWSKEYNRNNFDEVKQAFEDGADRNSSYLRGYLKF